MTLHQSARLFGLVLVPALVLSGCDFLTEPEFKEDRHSVARHVEGAALDVRTANGRIEVRRITGDEVTVDATIACTTMDRLARSQIATTRGDDGTLIVGIDWADGQRANRESCSLRIGIPSARRFVLRSSNGRISMGDFTGVADVKTSNGRIVVRNFDGPVTAETSNGRITLEHIGGAIDAKTSNGRLTLSLSDDNVGPVNAKTSNGRVKLAVGEAFGGHLEARTSNGKVKVDLPRTVKVNRMKRGQVAFAFGGQGQSLVKTSNGTVSVRRNR